MIDLLNNDTRDNEPLNKLIHKLRDTIESKRKVEKLRKQLIGLIPKLKEFKTDDNSDVIEKLINACNQINPNVDKDE